MSFDDFLLGNSKWLDITSTILAFLSGLLGIFYSKTIKEGTKKLTGWGWFTLATFLTSTLVQVLLKQAELNEKKLIKASEEKVARDRFDQQLARLQLLTDTLIDFKDTSINNDRKNNIEIQKSLDKLETVNSELYDLNEFSANNLNRIRQLNVDFNKSNFISNEIKRIERLNLRYRAQLDSLNAFVLIYFENLGSLAYISKNSKGILELRNTDKSGLIPFDQYKGVKFNRENPDIQMKVLSTFIYDGAKELSRTARELKVLMNTNEPDTSTVSNNKTENTFQLNNSSNIDTDLEADRMWENDTILGLGGIINKFLVEYNAKDYEYLLIYAAETQRERRRSENRIKAFLFAIYRNYINIARSIEENIFKNEKYLNELIAKEVAK